MQSNKNEIKYKMKEIKNKKIKYMIEKNYL